MGLDMRMNSGRCPPFLLAGCVLLCIVLVCNWWTFSSQNYDLIKQIEFLEEQMRVCCDERDTCTNDRNKLDGTVGQLKIQIEKQKGDKEVLKRRDNEITMCKTELESLKNVDASRSESLNALRTTLDEKKEEIKRLNEQIGILTAYKSNDALSQIKNRNPSVKDVNEDKAEEDVQINEENDDTTDTNNEGDRELQMAANTA